MTKDEFDIVKDICTIIASGVAVYVGLVGLKAWKKQLKGKTEYELARRYLTAVYKLRDALKDARSPLKSIDEIHSDYINEPTERTFMTEFLPRWKHITEVVSLLNVEVFEAEVLWGRQAKEIVQPLIFCTAKLYISAEIKREGERDDQDNVVFARFDEKDALSTEINIEISKIEAYIREPSIWRKSFRLVSKQMQVFSTCE